jgi:hypothetical protein
MPLFTAQSSPAARLGASAPGFAGAVDDIPPVPPAEVLDAMGTAAQAYDRLKTSGRELHFETDPMTGKLTVQVLDPEGNVLTTLPPSQVLDLATGGTLA